MMSWHVLGLYLGWLFAAFLTFFFAIFAMFALIHCVKSIRSRDKGTPLFGMGRKKDDLN